MRFYYETESRFNISLKVYNFWWNTSQWSKRKEDHWKLSILIHYFSFILIFSQPNVRSNHIWKKVLPIYLCYRQNTMTTSNWSRFHSSIGQVLLEDNLLHFSETFCGFPSAACVAWTSWNLNSWSSRGWDSERCWHGQARWCRGVHSRMFCRGSSGSPCKGPGDGMASSNWQRKWPKS